MKSPMLKAAAVAAIAAIVTITYVRVPTFDFVNLDDQAHIEQNAALKKFDLWHIWTHEHKDMYIPIFYSTLAVQTFVSSSTPRFHAPNPHVTHLDPLVFHTTSLLLHVVNSILIFYILMGFRFQVGAALIGALVYSLHPLQVEVVSWVSAQKDLTSSFFVICMILCFQKRIEKKNPASLGEQLGLSTIALLALLAKPTTVFLAPLLIFWWVKIEQRSLKKARVFFFTTTAWCLIFALVASNQQPDQSLPFQINFFEKLWVSLDTITFYLKKIFYPIHLAVDYGRNPPAFLNSSDRYWTWAPAILLLYSLKRAWPKCDSQTKLSLALILLSLAPVLGLKGFVYQNISTVSDRYMTVPLIGISILVARALQSIPKSHFARILIYAAAGSWVFGCAYISHNQSRHWQNIDSLWSHTTQVNPKSWFGFNNWAAHYEKIGDRKRAIELYEKSLALRPDSLVYTRVGILYFDQGDRTTARASFEKALRLNPNNAIAAQNYQVLSQ